MIVADKKTVVIGEFHIEAQVILDAPVFMMSAYAIHRDSSSLVRLWSEPLDIKKLKACVSVADFFLWLAAVAGYMSHAVKVYEANHASCNCIACGINGLIADLFDPTSGMLCRVCLSNGVQAVETPAGVRS